MQENSAKEAQIPNKDVFSTEELSKYLGISTRTIQKWRDEGEIEFTQVNHVILYSKKNVADFMETYARKRP